MASKYNNLECQLDARVSEQESRQDAQFGKDVLQGQLTTASIGDFFSNLKKTDDVYTYSRRKGDDIYTFTFTQENIQHIEQYIYEDLLYAYNPGKTWLSRFVHGLWYGNFRRASQDEINSMYQLLLATQVKVI